MTVTEDIRYIGVNDHDIDLFEAQYTVPEGMSYNSYVILDEKVAVMDTVDGRFGGEWLGNLEKVLSGRTPDYLVVQHMEPDHSANIAVFAEKYPSAKIVASKQAFVMMKQFFGTDYADRQVVAAEKDTLELGKHTLNFIAAPMVHWPEVIMTYDSADKVLFTADGFGKFGALDAAADAEWDCEARRYYFGIVGKYGAQVQALLKKAAGLEIEMICPLHGPVWRKDIAWFLDKYIHWATYTPEDDAVVIAYASVYGGTENAANILACRLREQGVQVEMFDTSVTPASYILAAAFRFSHVVLAAPTYNGGVFVTMENLLHDLTTHGLKGRRAAYIENGSWAPTSARGMQKLLEPLNWETAADTVTLRSALRQGQQEDLERMATQLAESVKA